METKKEIIMSGFELSEIADYCLHDCCCLNSLINFTHFSDILQVKITTFTSIKIFEKAIAGRQLHTVVNGNN